MFARGEGALLWDREGKRDLDGLGGGGLVGHGRREIAEAMARQAAIAYVHGTRFASEALVTYALLLGGE